MVALRVAMSMLRESRNCEPTYTQEDKIVSSIYITIQDLHRQTEKEIAHIPIEITRKEMQNTVVCVHACMSTHMCDQ